MYVIFLLNIIFLTRQNRNIETYKLIDLEMISTESIKHMSTIKYINGIIFIAHCSVREGVMLIL